MRVTALIPVKGFRNAKQRLSPLLGASDRELLAEAMVRDLLRAVRNARGLAAAFVVTSDECVAEIAAEYGAAVIREAAEAGETGAVEIARSELQRAGHEAVLILPGDMPRVRASDIEQVLAQVPIGAAAPFALLVPSYDRLGTNALLLAPPGVIELRFGYNSFSYHLGQVSARGLPLRFFENEAIALDIDEPKDLRRFLAAGFCEGEAYRVASDVISRADARPRRSESA